jgi:hypothetical protein
MIPIGTSSNHWWKPWSKNKTKQPRNKKKYLWKKPACWTKLATTNNKLEVEAKAMEGCLVEAEAEDEDEAMVVEGKAVVDKDTKKKDKECHEGVVHGPN